MSAGVEARIRQAKRLLAKAAKAATGSPDASSPTPGPGSPAFAKSPAAHLRSVGYSVEDGWVQKEGGPSLSLGVAEHEEIGGHTVYKVQCLLLVDSEPVKWHVGRRLRHLREQLHDPLKAQLGVEAYARLFKGQSFAPRGGGRGTTKVLGAWCQRLASCANAGQLPPGALSFVLQFFEAPPALARNTSEEALGTPVAVGPASPAAGHGGAYFSFAAGSTPTSAAASRSLQADLERAAEASGPPAEPAASEGAASDRAAGPAAAARAAAAQGSDRAKELVPRLNLGDGALTERSTECNTSGAGRHAGSSAKAGSDDADDLASEVSEDGTMYSDDSFDGGNADGNICGQMQFMIQQLELDLEAATLEGAENKDELAKTLTEMRDWAANLDDDEDEDEESSEPPP